MVSGYRVVFPDKVIKVISNLHTTVAMPLSLASPPLGVEYASLEHLVGDMARGQRGKRKEEQSSGEGVVVKILLHPPFRRKQGYLQRFGCNHSSH